jgi:hypothetical protein
VLSIPAIVLPAAGLVLCLIITPPGTPDGPPDGPPVSPSQLAAAYVRNQAAANDQHTGRPVDVTGHTLLIAEGSLGKTAISMADFYNPFALEGVVVCQFPLSERGNVKNVTRGDHITARGTRQGPAGRQILLTNCRLLKVEEQRPIRVR